MIKFTKTPYSCSAFGFSYLFDSFSHKRICERIERKFKTQNPCPRRITYQEQTQTFGVISMRHDIQGKDGLTPVRPSASTLTQSTSSSSSVGSLGPRSSSGSSNANMDFGQEQEVYSLLIIDQHTFEVLHAHQFMQQEYAISLISCMLGNDPHPYYVVGTGLVSPEESEAKSGRIIIFQWKVSFLYFMYLCHFSPKNRI